MRGLSRRVCLVLGGARGIGAATARRLAEEGAPVVVADIDAAGATSVADDLAADGCVASAAWFDLADEASVHAVVAATVARHGRLDGAFVNVADLAAATVGRDTDACEVPLEVFDRTLAINLRGHLVATRAIVPALLAVHGGTIVYASSDAAVTGDPSLPSYAISKSGLNALMRHVASRWGKQNVRANAVSPGMVLRGHERERTAAFERARVAVAAQTRSPRLGRPQDVAAMVAFLLSEDGDWVTGQVICVDGGLVMR